VKLHPDPPRKGGESTHKAPSEFVVGEARTMVGVVNCDKSFGEGYITINMNEFNIPEPLVEKMTGQYNRRTQNKSFL
jgi:hypothetical protein